MADVMQLEIKRRISPWANGALICLLITPVIFMLSLVVAPGDSLGVAVLLSSISLFMSALLGLIALIHIKLAKGVIGGYKRAVSSLLISATGWYLAWTALQTTMRQVEQLHSASQLRSLGSNIMIYQKEHGALPDGNDWCDRLLTVEYMSRDMFCNPAVGQGDCHYAMNKYLSGYKGKLPNDVVVLFESKNDEWNQSGGPELMATDYHLGASWKYQLTFGRSGGNKGCLIIFGDGHCDYVTPDDFDKLRWQVE